MSNRSARSVILFAALVALGIAALPDDSLAQRARPDSTAKPVEKPKQAPGIQDNSFIIEEAYNQEPGVVQHISTFVHDQEGAGYAYQFTQEWPVPGVRHQLSYSIPLMRSDEASGIGLGDARINYRYQLVGDGEATLAIAPRLTAILPVGDNRRGRGDGAVGVEAWFPASIVLTDQLVAHANLGLTLIPRAKAGDVRGTKQNWAAGGSLIWLTRRNFNAMLEVLYQHPNDASVLGSDNIATTTISPGIRWAYNFASGLQIVPGIGIPIEVSSGPTTRSVLVYLSFEHPFTKEARAKAKE